MSNVQTGASRDAIDLDHFVFSSGSIGRLKVLDTVPVCAGDSFKMDMVGSFRLSPLRRGIVIDTHVDVFTFYVPHRHTYGQAFVDLLKTGIPKTGSAASLPTDACAVPDAFNSGYICSFLGTHHGGTDASPVLPKYFYQSYLQIYNNYFKIPAEPDVATALASLSPNDLKDGFVCAQLDSIWTKPLPSQSQTKSNYAVDATTGIDIMGLNAAYGVLNTQQERDYFMTRYREVVGSMGGSTHYDADNRPHLVMRSQFWASGENSQGATQETLGQFQGSTQQTFVHSIPRFYVPEHGVMMTVCVPRFPVIHQYERHYLTGKASLDYYDIANDPSLTGNRPPRDVPINNFFISGSGQNGNIKIAEGQWYRDHPSFVDRRYAELQGYPFLLKIGKNERELAMCNSDDYNTMFQTKQLGQWNAQIKSNVTCFRQIPTVRDSILTN